MFAEKQLSLSEDEGRLGVVGEVRGGESLAEKRAAVQKTSFTRSFIFQPITF